MCVCVCLKTHFIPWIILNKVYSTAFCFCFPCHVFMHVVFLSMAVDLNWMKNKNEIEQQIQNKKAADLSLGVTVCFMGCLYWSLQFDLRNSKTVWSNYSKNETCIVIYRHMECSERRLCFDIFLVFFSTSVSVIVFKSRQSAFCVENIGVK